VRFLQPSLSKALLLVGGILSFAGLPAQAQQFTVGNYQQISQRRISLYVYEYVYQAYVSNSGAAAINVVGTATSTSSHTTIIDDTLTFGDVAANTSTLSLNTFRFQQDRRYAFSFSNLQWTISSVTAQPPIANAGPAQTVAVGTTVTLNGSGSSDPNGSGIVKIQWAFDSIPTGSAATLENATTFSPSFVADVAGQYIVRLTITDALDLTGTSAVTISTSASAPVANAGISQTVPVGTTVTLDGSRSTDVDGAPLTFSWSFVSIPAGSTAVLNNPTAVKPTFTVDKVGNYVVQLVVTAEGLTSAPSQVTISTTDVPPVANAGSNQTVTVGSVVSLNGSGSSDLAGNPITFLWSFVSLPTGSTATLSSSTAVNPTFVADRVGEYVLQLVVNDGILSSKPSTVTITSNDVAPVANAGTDQTVMINATVTLDGSKSSDSDGNPLTYSWALTVKPAGSNASLLNATTVHPSFTVDLDGTYVAQLIVNDGFLDSAPATVTISTQFSAPIANAGSNQTVNAESTVQLNGSGSSDPDGSPLTYSWTILTKPGGSTATLSNASIVNPTFFADLVGTYLVQLTVSSNGLTSPPSTVTITATTGTASKLAFTVQPSNTASGASIAPAVVVSIEDAHGNVVTSATNSVTIAISTNPASGTLSGTTTVAAVAGVATFSNLSIKNAGTGYILGASATGLASATSSAFNITSTNTMVMTTGSPLVGVSRSITGTVTVSPAPTSSLTVALSSSNTAIATVSAASITIAAGSTTGTFSITGVAAGGPVVISATATGYPTATASVSVTGSEISIATGLVVAPGQTSSLAFSLSSPAPAGGVTVNFSSSSTSIGTITASVFVPAGATVASSNPEVTGIEIGTINVTASAAGFAPDTESVQVSVTASLASTNISVNATLTTNDQLNISAAAPQPSGITFTLSIDHTNFATVPATVTIPAGQLSVQIPVAGVAAGSATLTVTSLGINTVKASITVNPAPAITVASQTIGNNMYTQGSISLGAAPTASENLTLTSSNPTHILLSTSATTAGSSSITLPLTGGSTAVPTFYIQGQNFSGSTGITSTLTASATGFTTGTGTATLYPSGFTFLSSGTLSTTTTAGPSPLTIYFVVLSPGTLTYYTYGYPLGPQALAVSLSVSSSNTSIGTITGSPASLAVGSYSTQAISFSPTTAGTTNLTLAEPSGYNTPSNEPVQIVATVAAPSMSVTAGIVGNNMVITGSVSLTSPAPTTETLSLTSSDPTHILLSNSATTVGSASIKLALTAGSTSVPTFYIEGQNYSGTSAINATLTATATGLGTATGTATLYPSGIGFLGASTLNTTTTSAPSPLTVYFLVLSPGTLTYYTVGYPLGPQASAIPVAISSSNTSIGTITGSPSSIAVGSYSTSAISFQPVSGGTTNLTLTEPSGYSTPSNESIQIAATVSAPSITISAPIIGNNMITAGAISLQSPPAVSETLTLTSSDATHILLSNSASTVGSASIKLALTAGSTSVPTFYIEGQNYSGTSAINATLTATATGFTTGTATATLYPSGIGFLSGATLGTTTFSTPSPLTVYFLVLSPGTLTYYTVGYPLGPQASAIPVAISSSNTSIGTITGSPSSIAVGSYSNSVISFVPATAGTTNLALTEPTGYGTPSNEPIQIAATVSAPSITISAPIIGNNMVTQGSISLAAPPPTSETLTITSSDTKNFLLSKSATTVGSSSITLTLTAGSTSVPAFYIEGQNFSGAGAITATLTASAPGYSDGTGTATLYPSGLSFLTTSLTTSSTSGPSTLTAYFVVLNPGTLTYYTSGYALGPQASAIPVSISSSNTSVGTISGSPSSIAVGSYYTQAVSFQPVASGSTNIVMAEPSGYSTPSDYVPQIAVTVN
jgi:hypothetical protein